MFEALFSFVRCGHEEPDEVQKEQEAAPSNSSFWNLLRCGTEEPDHWDYDVEEGTESISDHESLQALQDNTRTNETLQAKTSEMINMTPSPSNQHQTDGRRVRFSVQSPSASFPSSHSSSPVSSPSSCLPYLPDTGVRCKSSPPSIPSLKTVHILNGANKENEENEGGNGGKKQQQGKRSGSGRLAVVLREAKPQIRQQITTEGLDYFFTPTPLKYTNPTPYRLKKNKRSNLAPTSTYLTLHEFGHRPDSNNDDKPALYVRCILEETEHTPPICDETSSCMFPRNQEGAKFIQELEEHANAIKKHWKMLRGEPVDSPEKTPESTPGKAEKTLDNEEKEELLLTEPISLSSTPQKPVDQIERNSEEVAIEGMEEEDLKKQGAQVELVHVRRAAIKKGLRKTPTPRKFSSVPDAAVQQGKEEEATEQVTLTPSSLDQERQRKNRPRSRNPRRRSRKKSPHPKTPTGQKTPTEQKTGQAKQDKTKSPWARTHARQRTPKQKTPTEKMVYRQKTRQEEMTRGQENDPVRVLALARVKEALEMVQKQQQQEQQALDRVKKLQQQQQQQQQQKQLLERARQRQPLQPSFHQQQQQQQLLQPSLYQQQQAQQLWLLQQQQQPQQLWNQQQQQQQQQQQHQPDRQKGRRRRPRFREKNYYQRHYQQNGHGQQINTGWNKSPRGHNGFQNGNVRRGQWLSPIMEENGEVHG